MGFLSPAPIFAICAHTGHVRGLTTFSAPLRGFVARARVTASATTIDRYPDHRRALLAPDSDLASVFAVPIEVDMGPAEAPAAATTAAQPTPSRRSTQGTDSVEPAGPAASASASPGSPAPQTVRLSSGRISIQTRRRLATAAGKTPPAFDYGFGPGGAPLWLWARRGLPITCQPSYHHAASPTAAVGSTRRRDPRSCPLAGPHGANPVRPRPRRACGNSSLTAFASSWRHAGYTYTVGCRRRRY